MNKARRAKTREINRQLTNLVRRYHLRCDEIGGFSDGKKCPRDMQLMLRLHHRLQQRLERLQFGRVKTELEQLAEDEASEARGLALMAGEPY